MIKRLAAGASTYYSSRGIIARDKQEVYAYGFELLISTILNIAGILIISMYYGSILCAVLFMLAFVPLRLSAGGYHAKHHVSCILGFNTIFLGFVLLLKHIDPDVLSLYSLISVTVSAIFVWCFAPVEATNKPLKSEQRQHQRTNSIVLASINLVVAFVYFLVPSLPVVLLSYYVSGVLCASILLLIAKIFN